ncbi:MAG: MotA/TolQ/ExbB proton channel family protein [Rhodothermia bacterium]|nr:MotA/TolQ/ExbB proton channel family protein [Rhodothermia bacterium]
MATNTQTAKKPSAGFPVALVIPVIFLITWLIYLFVLGDGSNFQGGNNANEPLPGNYLGVVYKGGFIVPFLMGFFLIVVVAMIERFFTLNKAKGKGSIAEFVRKIQAYLHANDVDGAIAECDKQRGSVASVVRNGLVKYGQMQSANDLTMDQKVGAIASEIEESTSLELPILEKNLPILATLAPTATLLGLIGTVLGMIKAFAALANAGAPDAGALATGISEALINTALGISTSFFAIIAYSYFTNKIDQMTYGIDEASFSMQQTFANMNR